MTKPKKAAEPAAAKKTAPAGRDPRAGAKEAEKTAEPGKPAVERSAVAGPLVQQTAEEHAAERGRRRVSVDDDVTVTVPTPFRLQIAPGVIVQYLAGVQEMPRSHAEHQYAVDNGVKAYQKK